MCNIPLENEKRLFGFYDRLKKIRVSFAGLPYLQLGDGYTQIAYNPMDAENVKKVVNTIGIICLRQLFGCETEHVGLPTDEQKLLQIFRSVPDNKKSYIYKRWYYEGIFKKVLRQNVSIKK